VVLFAFAVTLWLPVQPSGVHAAASDVQAVNAKTPPLSSFKLRLVVHVRLFMQHPSGTFLG
jgi:hypothetical protein